MRWYFQVRAVSPERAASRVLQVLETQRVQPQRFDAVQCSGAMHLRFLLDGSQAQAYRIGWLLRRLPTVDCAHWLPVEDEEDEQQFWHCTALATMAVTQSAVDPGPFNLDPHSEWWHTAPSVLLLADNQGMRVPEHDTDVRLRWTRTHLYLLFNCRYQHLSLLPGEPLLHEPTPALWEHDVAEVFLGVDSSPFRRYMEFEVSPRGEWIDLDITAASGVVTHRAPLHSGCHAAAHIDRDARRWLACLRIPLPSATGDDLRLNLFRSQGPGPVELAWQPTHQESFHVPECFGYLRLIAD